MSQEQRHPGVLYGPREKLLLGRGGIRIDLPSGKAGGEAPEEAQLRELADGVTSDLSSLC